MSERTRPHQRDRPGVFRLLREALSMVRTAGAPLLGLILGTQLLITTIASPVLGWLFREALRAGGMPALDLFALRPEHRIGITIALILLICLLAFWLVALQFTLLVVTLRAARRGERITLRTATAECGHIVRKLLRPSALPLHFYLFVVLPFSGFGFASALARGVSLPPSISTELVKSESGTVLLVILTLTMIVLNVRFATAVPVFVMSDTTGGRALRASWRLTRGTAFIPLVGAVLLVLVAAGLATGALVIAALAPTVFTDELAAAASPVVAAYSLGAAQTIGVLLTGLVTATIAAILIAFVEARSAQLPTTARLRENGNRGAGAAGDEGAPASIPSPHIPAAADTEKRPGARRRPMLLVSAAAVALVLGLGTAAIDTMRTLSTHPDTLILAHRGFSDGGVENTIGGLEAAAEAGAELVEMDVMQTSDGGFVAMHDPHLGRLAERDAQVKELTLAELTDIAVHDAYDNEGFIPSFADYVTRAAELDMPLLIEIKLGGADTPDHVDLLVAELEELGLLEGNIYHSLDPASVERLKQLRPDLTVGYTMPLAAVAVPETPADFIVVEVWSATPEIQRSAEENGLGFMAWTVNEPAELREHLRRGTDGIITDHPDLALAARAEMQEETGLADVLIDAITRFVTVL